MIVLMASMMTWREGRRFSSRPLAEAEAQVVVAAIQLLASLEQRPGSPHILQKMMQDGRIRAMDRFTFARPQERNAFGYTDERGRILLNPHLCFAYQRTLSPRLIQGVAEADLVATMATLHHELGHLLGGASEAAAYEQEWRFVGTMQRWCREHDRQAVAAELLEWEQHLPSRVRLHVGGAAAETIRQRVQSHP
jgi:hypothetical protein